MAFYRLDSKKEPNEGIFWFLSRYWILDAHLHFVSRYCLHFTENLLIKLCTLKSENGVKIDKNVIFKRTFIVSIGLYWSENTPINTP